MLVLLYSALLGYVYAGAPLRGLAVLAVATMVGWAALLFSLDAAGPASFLAWMVLLVATGVVVIVDLWRVARSGAGHYTLRWYNRWYVYAVLAVVLLPAGELLSYAVRETAHAFRIPSASMRPTLESGDHVLVDKKSYWSNPPARFDVVVFETPDSGKVFIKRVIGLPGETVELRNREVFVDGVAIEEPHVASGDLVGTPREPRDTMPPTLVPERSYFLLGDNRDHSYDSRFTGMIPLEDIEGRVAIRYFSWSETSPHVRWDRIGTPVR
jgi:signal peptidase I